MPSLSDARRAAAPPPARSPRSRPVDHTLAVVGRWYIVYPK